MSVKPLCYYCHAVLTNTGHRRLTWDHKIPKSKGGKRTPNNLVPACFICNQEKGTMSEEQFKAILMTRMKSMIGEVEKPKEAFKALFTPELTLEDYKFLYEIGAGY
jgi:5-methylcytosine-specific restriction endonuclease McrA